MTNRAKATKQLASQAHLADEVPRTPEDRVQVIERRLYTLEADAYAAGFDFLAHLIGVAALASTRHLPEVEPFATAPGRATQARRSKARTRLTEV